DGHRAVVLGAVDGILKGAVLAHQADRVIEIVLANLAPLQRLDPESALAVIAAAERQHHRQRDLALAEIVADVLAELGGLAAVVEHIVDKLERDAEIHADRTACGLLRLRAVGNDRTDLAGGSEQFGGLAADHGKILILGGGGILGGSKLHHFAFGDRRGSRRDVPSPASTSDAAFCPRRRSGGWRPRGSWSLPSRFATESWC